jgi:DNA-directed RNA polymerase specialized sigma24 family protein
MFTRDEEHAIAAIAALLAALPATRRSVVASAALQRLSSAPISATRDAPTERVATRVTKPDRGER